MADQMSVSEMFAELARLRLIDPAREQDDLVMPNLYRFVPSYQTYGIPDIPVQTGALSDARLEKGSPRNRG